MRGNQWEDADVVVENIVASYQAAVGRRNLTQTDLAQTIAWSLAEIYSAWPSMYHQVAWPALTRVNDPDIARAILRDPDSDPDIALEPGTFLVSGVATRAKTLFAQPI